MYMPQLITVCADIGSVKNKNFGWWSSQNGQEGNLPSTLAQHVATLLSDGLPVALGFECPMFVPIAKKEYDLAKGREGEGSRAWSAGAGCGALATGMVQIAWVLDEINRLLPHKVPAFLQWSQFTAAASGLFLWEAFVTGKAKCVTHVNDAQAGAQAFIQSLPNPDMANAVKCEGQVFSLVGAALLRTNWSEDITLLSEPCLVLRAS